MADIGITLSEKIQAEFERTASESTALRALEKKVEDGKATYIDADNYAKKVGDILGSLYEEYIVPENFPGGVLYYNIARSIVDPICKKAYERVSDYIRQVQELLNQEAGLGLKAIPPGYNQDKADGIIEYMIKAMEAEHED